MSYAQYKCIVVALSKDVDYESYEFDDSNVLVYEFKDADKFTKYISADFIKEISDKCGADWLGDNEEQPLFSNTLPIAIDIVSKAIKQKKNAEIVDYLEKTKELMEIALAKDTFIEFCF